MPGRALTVLVWLAVVFALVVLGVLISSRVRHRSPDQQILIDRSRQH